jgi:hypothetical protein
VASAPAGHWRPRNPHAAGLHAARGCPPPGGFGTRGSGRRATRSQREPPSDAEIERGLRERAVKSARDAEVLLRWRQTVRPSDTPPGVDLESLSERELERLYAGLVRLASMDEAVLDKLVEHVLAREGPGSSE